MSKDPEIAKLGLWKKPGVFEENERLRRALRNIANGEFPVAVGKRYRTDGQPSKNDQCVHGQYMYESCDSCIVDYVNSVLGESDAR